MKRILVLLPLALAACGGPTQTADPQRAQCERQAQDDPAVRQFAGDADSPNIFVRTRALQEQKDVMRQAVQRCLRLRGLAPPGGVEPVQRGGWF
jgi:hypothetical protein